MTSHTFDHFAARASAAMGHPVAFLLAVFFIVAWAITGPFFRFSETWQLVINTGTTIVTFLLVFLIQNTQNRQEKAIQLKLDNLTLAIKDASNQLMQAENKSPQELNQIREQLTEQASCAEESSGG